MLSEKDNMQGRSWRSLAAASSRFNSFRNSLPNALRQATPSSQASKSKAASKQTWREWAGLKKGASSGTDELALFPGWATRRHRPAGDGSFEIDIFVSGFASAHRAPEFVSRSQRAFMRLAKGFAALPKLIDDPEDLTATNLTPSTEELLRTVQLPPRPTEMTEEREIELLEQHFKRLNSAENGSAYGEDSASSSSSRSESPERNSPQADNNPITAATTIPDELLRKLHTNLEARLRPFWSSTLSGRTVRIRIFVSHDDVTEHIVFRDVQTAPDGSFQMLFRIGWEDLCQHPPALPIVFGEANHEHDLQVTAELLPSKSPAPSAASSTTDLTIARTLLDMQPRAQPTAATSIRVPLTHSSIRVISDIDDTIKHSDITGGARSVFRNVFVNELEDLVIPGMGDWYTRMWSKGVRFHYVSNGPFELLPILGDFFKEANLPPGSIKLRSYAGRSLFSGLLSAPATRKRAGVQDLLNAFPNSQFILIGDSGEQDLELYAEIAKDYPAQVLGVFIRDAGSGDALEDPTGFRVTTAYDLDMMSPIEQPVLPWLPPTPTTPTANTNGDKRLAPIDTKTLQATQRVPSGKTPTTPYTANSSIGGYFRSKVTSEPDSFYADSSRNSSSSSLVSLTLGLSRRIPGPGTPSHRGSGSSTMSYFGRTPKTAGSTSTISLSGPEKRRNDLQMRVYKARSILPEHIVLRVFKSPEECVEDVDTIMASLTV